MEGRIQFPYLGENPSFETRKAAIQLVRFTDGSRSFQGGDEKHYYQQRFNAFDADGHLTVRQYLETVGFKEEKSAHQELLELVGLHEMLERERIKLSSGQTRKLLLTKSLLSEPDILLLDSPYIGLDVGSRKLLNDLLDTLVEEKGMHLVIASKETDLPASVKYRLELEEGRGIQQGKIEEFESLPTKLEIDANAEAGLEFLQKKYKGQHFPEVLEILRMSQVDIGYGNTQILEDFNWEVLKGEKWALYGQNGSGKSTVLSLIYADNPQAYSKEVYLFEQKRGSGESIWDIKSKIGFSSPELHSYFLENIPAIDLVLSGFTESHRLQRKVKEEEVEIAKALFQYFGMEEKQEEWFLKLSNGEQRLLFLMRALVKAPPLLLLDEPFQGLDEATILKAKHLLEVCMGEEHSLIFITHFEHEIPGNVDKKKVLA